MADLSPNTSAVLLAVKAMPLGLLTCAVAAGPSTEAHTPPPLAPTSVLTVQPVKPRVMLGEGGTLGVALVVREALGVALGEGVMLGVALLLAVGSTATRSQTMPMGTLLFTAPLHSSCPVALRYRATLVFASRPRPATPASMRGYSPIKAGRVYTPAVIV